MADRSQEGEGVDIMLRRVMGAVKDLSERERDRIREAVQAALNDGSMNIEFLVKEKNQRILHLEDEKRRLQVEANRLRQVRRDKVAEQQLQLQHKNEELAEANGRITQLERASSSGRETSREQALQTSLATARRQMDEERARARAQHEAALRSTVRDEGG